MMKDVITSVAILIASTAIVTNAQPTIYEVDNWMNGETFSPMTIQVGDKVNFSWMFGTHNVYTMNSLDCDFDTQIGDNSSPVLVDIFDSPGEYYIGCAVGNHCDFGQKIQITVVEAMDMGMEEGMDMDEEMEMGMDEEMDEGGKKDKKKDKPKKKKLKKGKKSMCDDESLAMENVISETTEKKANKCKKACLKEEECNGYQFGSSEMECILLSVIPTPVAGSDGFECGFVKSKKK